MAADILRTRAELLCVELAQEQAQVGALALLAAIAVVSSALGLQFAALLVVAWAWDTPHRWTALAAVAGFFVAIGCVCARAFFARWRSKPAPFGSTLAALEADADAFRKTP